MNWIPLTTPEQLVSLTQSSAQKPQVIFKHSTRCSTSSLVLNRLDRETSPSSVDFYFLDLLKYRSLSNKVAEDFQVHHESPQILVILNGRCVYDESHMGIDLQEILTQAK